jgi:hypothetical protein
MPHEMSPIRESDIRALQEQIERDFESIDKRLDQLDKDLRDLEKLVVTLKSAADRVWGGVVVVLALGGIVGYLTSLGETILKFWPFHK